MEPTGQSFRLAAGAHRRGTVRNLAAAASALTAILHVLIGFGMLSVVTEPAVDAPPMLVFGLSAGGAFALGAVLLLAFDRRVLWILGALLQVGVVVMYVNVAPQRTPSFEAWGITIKVLEVLIFGALAYLVIRPPQPETRTSDPSRLDATAGTRP